MVYLLINILNFLFIYYCLYYYDMWMPVISIIWTILYIIRNNNDKTNKGKLISADDPGQPDSEGINKINK